MKICSPEENGVAFPLALPRMIGQLWVIELFMQQDYCKFTFSPGLVQIPLLLLRMPQEPL